MPETAVPGRSRGTWQWWLRLLLRRTWYVHRPVVMLLRAEPAACFQAMTTAARPSTERLHLRNLFAHGRRYNVNPLAGGFRITTTSSIPWRYRKRTASTAILRGYFFRMGEDVIRIDISARINVGYLLDSFLLPTLMTSILIFIPWSPVIIGVSIVALYILSWFGHRFNARLEANDMVWFVQKALEDFEHAEVARLSEETAPETVELRSAFEAEWEKFMQQMQRDGEEEK